MPNLSTKTGRKAIWAAIIVAVAWLFISSATGPLAGKLSEVQKNDNAAFLPASAESTKVNDEVKAFASSDALPILVVVSRPDGAELTKADQSLIAMFVGQIPTIVVPDGAAISTYTDGSPIAPIPSADGRAVLISVPLSGTAVSERLPNGDPVITAVTDALRTQGTASLAGLQVNVSGPGGILADLFSVFGAIDTTLLGATLLVVVIILILVYRSPFLWVIPLTGAVFSLTTASAIVYALAKANILVLNGQSQGLLTVLVLGASTDYGLLLVSRYREELHNYAVHTDAIKAAWKGVVEPIVASAATVSVGLLCLLLSDLNSNKSTGPVAAAGILGALVVMLTLVPALLAIPSVTMPLIPIFALGLIGLLGNSLFGIPAGPMFLVGLGLAAVLVVALIVLAIRGSKIPAGIWVFWPKVPRVGQPDERESGVWGKVAQRVGRKPRITWMVTAVGLLILAGFSLTLKADGISTTQAFTSNPDSVIGQEVISAHFPGGQGSPTIVISSSAEASAVNSAITATPGIANVQQNPKVVDGKVEFFVTLSDPADSSAAEDTVSTLRTNVHAVPGADALVGGTTAISLDTKLASIHDRNLIIPVVLVVITLILMLLLRSIVAPVLLIGTVVLSFIATLGMCALFFNHVFKFAGADPSFPLFAFVFLVALGVDYNIFLMTRVREESVLLGTRPGILKGLTVTGGVITSAGIVLAATFLVLGVLPLVFLRELGFAVAAGVILDTFIVRSLLVPALSYDIGKKIWWPSKLASKSES